MDPNYTVNLANATGTSQITAEAITVTAQAATKAYDGTTTSNVSPTVTSGSLGSGDTAAFKEPSAAPAAAPPIPPA